METPSATLVSATTVDVEAPKKKPKRVIHFSDGTLEEYSDEEELRDGEDATAAASPHRHHHHNHSCHAAVAEKKSPQQMRWGEYLLHVTMNFGVKSLHFCDYLGEKFAWALGITSPKYGYAIEEREWQKKEEAEEKAREERERVARLKRNAVGPEATGVDIASTRDVSQGVDLHPEADILSAENEKY